MSTFKQWLRQFSPAYRRSIEKRRLESILRDHGLSKKTAREAVNEFFNELKESE
jgi:hypothetical protein